MIVFRNAALFALLTMICACSDGGSSSSSAPSPAWPRFRHDSGNSGQGTGFVSTNPGLTQGPFDLRGEVSSSPAISADGTVFISTETCTATGCTAIALPTCPCVIDHGGILAAVSPTSFQPRWTIQANEKCVGNQQLGAMVSSPAVYTLDERTSIFVGSEDGRVHGLRDTATEAGVSTPSADFCFDPTQLPETSRVASARFTSSPAISVSQTSGAVEGIFIGAEVATSAGAVEGRIYSLANDGSLRWQFPRPGSPSIAPVSSSPAVTLGSVYFLTDDGQLYALSTDGRLKWAHAIGPVRDAASRFSVSPVVSATGVFVATLDGAIVAINLDGSERWRRSNPSHLFQGSLALGALPSTPIPTETPAPLETPTPVATPTGAATTSPTPTRTPIPFLSSATLIGVTQNGELVMFNAAAPTPAEPPDSMEAEGEVLGSPALSADGQVVFATRTTSGGLVYVVDLLTGQPPPTPTGIPVPVPWPKAIDGIGGVSSPSVASDGTIWIATRDGKLYAIGPNP